MAKQYEADGIPVQERESMVFFGRRHRDRVDENIAKGIENYQENDIGNATDKEETSDVDVI